MLLGLVPVQGVAVEQRPLPVFRVFSPDGTAVSSQNLSGETRWILIYALPNCRPCDDVLHRLQYGKLSHLASRVVLVIGAPAAVA